MLRRLRVQFISLIMGIVFVVLTAVFATLCYMSYQQSVGEVYDALEDAVERTAISLKSNPPDDLAFENPREDNRQTVSENAAEFDEATSSDIDIDAGDTQDAQDSSNSEESETEQADEGGNESDEDAREAEEEERSVDSANGARESEVDACAVKPPSSTLLAFVPEACASEIASDSPQSEKPVPPAEESVLADRSVKDAQAQSAKEPSPSAGSPVIGGRDGNGPEQSVIPMAVLLVDPDGLYAPVGSSSTASISDDVISETVLAVKSKSDGTGFSKDTGLYYAKRTGADGMSAIAFADQSSVASWKSLAALCGMLEIIALALFFVVSMFFSRWALRPVEEAWAKQRRFVADASHKLKTPLTVILANASILLKHSDRTIASESKWIESTQTEALHMQGLVTEMLELAATEGTNASCGSRSFHTKSSPRASRDLVDMTDLVEGEALQFESVAFEHGISLKTAIDRNVIVRGNEQRLQRLASTLIDNACKYADQGGTVSIELKESVRDVRIIVENTGAVIPPEDLPYIFDRFYRADKARSREIGGFGLGLAIAQEIAIEHGGRITASSAEGTTKFEAVLPRTR